MGRQYGCLIVFMIFVGVCLTALFVSMIVGDGSGDGSGDGDPDAPRLRGGPTGGIIGLVAVWVIVGLVVVMARRQRARWASTAGATLLAQVPAVITAVRRANRVERYIQLRMPDDEEWVVLLEQGGSRAAFRTGDEVLVDVFPAADGGCAGAFRVERTGRVCQYSAARLPRSVASSGADDDPGDGHR